MTSAAEICMDWAETLRNDAELQAFVRESLGADLKIFVGYDAVREFGAADCPYVVMQPVEDGRGPEREENTCGIALFLGVALGKKYEEPEPGLYVHPALTLMEGEFAPRVLLSLMNSDFPPGQGDGEISPVINGYCEKSILLTITEPNTIGIGQNAGK